MIKIRTEVFITTIQYLTISLVIWINLARVSIDKTLVSIVLLVLEIIPTTIINRAIVITITIIITIINLQMEQIKILRISYAKVI